MTLNKRSDTTYSLPHRQHNKSSMRIFFININGLYSSTTKLQDVFVTARGINAEIIGMAETNTDWKKHHLQNRYTTALRQLSNNYKQFEAWKSANNQFTTSSIKTKTDSQRGGTVQSTVGKWVGRIMESGSDHELGRWSWQTFKGDTNLTIITAYRVCQEGGESGELTAHAQQHALLLKRTKNPDPRKQFLIDIKAFIEYRRHKGEAIVLMLDANEEAITPGSQLRQTMDSISMTNIHHLLHGEECPNTYTRGTEQIDHIYGCPIVAQNTINAGILPFRYGIDTDHRGLYIDIEVHEIFKSNTTEIRNPIRRRISSANTKHAEELRTIVNKRCINQNIIVRLQNLLKITTNRWTSNHQATLNQIDSEFTAIILTTETKVCHKAYGYPLSEKLIRAGQKLRYWKNRLTQAMVRGIKIKPITDQLATILQIPQDVHQRALSIEELQNERSKAYSALKNIQKESKKHREEWLLQRAQEAADKNNTTIEKALQRIISHEQSKRTYKRIERDMNHTTRSPVYYIEIPADGKPPKQSTQWKEIRDAETIYEQLLRHSEEHYRLAQNTPFGKTERGIHLGFTGSGQVAHSILDGTYSYKLDELHDEAKQFLKNLQRQECPQMKTTIAPHEVYQLFRKWDEKTATSPSKFHLGLYKTIIEHEQLLAIVTMLMNIPLKHGTTLKRWEKSTMCMIEKDRGSPKLHRLRLIHLFEADMNGIAKIIWARRFIYHCQKHNLLHQSQHGGLPGMETQHVLLKFRMTTDSAQIMRHNLAVTNNDAEACFDRIVPAINGIAHMAKGMPLNAVKMQNQLLLNMKYSVRTAHGVSEYSWTNDIHDPKFGLGQGGGWSPPGCASLSTDMIKTHGDVAPRGMTIASVTGSTNTTKRTIDAYVDDANAGVNDGEQQEAIHYRRLMEMLETSSQQWERIMNISGGNLNLNKCFCSVLSWKWKQDNPEHNTIIDTPGDITIVNSSTEKTSVITRLEVNEAFKLLGVWVQLQGNMKKQLAHMEKQIAQLNRDICQSNLTHREALIAYRQVAFKKLEYCLPMTIYTEKELETLQKPFTTAFLSNCGYHSGFPRSLVYAPKKYGGIGLDHMYQARGILQLKYMISHVRQKDELGKSIINIWEQTQLAAGIGTNIMSDTEENKVTYIHNNWLLTIRDFLKTFQGTLESANVWIPTPQRQHDTILMDVFHKWTTSRTKLQRINACRLYLRVLTVADITNTKGEAIEEAILNGTSEPQNSQLLWPRQPLPSKKCWKEWRSVIIATLLTSAAKPYDLEQKLRRWTRTPDITQKYVIDPDKQLLYIASEETGIYAIHHRITAHRQHRYETTPRGFTIMTSKQGIPTTIQTDTQWITPKYDESMISENTITASNFLQYIEGLSPAIYDLLKHVTLVANVETIADAIKQGHNLTVASDGSRKKKGGTFGWILEDATKITMAEGMGAVHGKYEILTSHRSELYGITSVLLFIFHITQYYQISKTETTIKAYCDNQECVNKTINYKQQIRGTSRFIAADYDIESTLKATLDKAPFKCDMNWVKGHQDQDDEEATLPNEAKLNIIADELAEYAYTVCDPSKDTIAPFPTTEISLLIKGSRVTSKMKAQIEEAIHIPRLKRYRNKKYGWDEHTWDMIDWEAYGIAQKGIDQGLARFLHRFTSEWLPVGQRTKFYQQGNNATCVSCQGPDEETCHHIFSCQNERRQNNFKMQLYKIFQVLRKKHTYKPILQALHHNIIRYYNDEELEPPTPIEHPKEYDITLQEAFKEQTTIGWNHILKGWVSHKWAQAQDEYYRNRAKQDERINRKYDNGIAWNKLLITELQAAAFTTWKFRNKDIYGHSKEEEEAIHLQKLKTTVRREYERRLTYPTRIQWRYFTRTVSDRVNDTAQMLQAWYINLKTAIAANEERPIVAIGTG